MVDRCMGLWCESHTELCVGASCSAVAILKFLKFEQRALHLILHQACSCVSGPNPSYVGGSGCRSKVIRKSSVREVWLGRDEQQNWAGAPQGCSRPGVRSGAALCTCSGPACGKSGWSRTWCLDPKVCLCVRKQCGSGGGACVRPGLPLGRGACSCLPREAQESPLEDSLALPCCTRVTLVFGMQ